MPIECIVPRVNPSVNMDLGRKVCLSIKVTLGMMMCQSRLITCNQYTNLVGDVENGGGGQCMCGAGSTWENLGVFLDFAINLQLL